ncbi:unnamed protein product, partial [Rangifer tarandus platyrhynchus]
MQKQAVWTFRDSVHVNTRGPGPGQAPSILKEASRSWAAQEVLHSESKGSGPKSGRPSGVWLWQDHIRGSLPVLRASSPLTGPTVPNTALPAGLLFPVLQPRLWAHITALSPF